jgi:hypothetical protein
MNLRATILIAFLLAAFCLAAPAQETNGVEKLDFDSFKIISQKNIFDPTRSARRANQGRPPPPKLVERVGLTGTFVDSGERVTFLSGNGVPDKPLKVGDTVKDLKIVQITEDGVRLNDPTNTFVLDFENRRSLRRVENGPWQGSSDQSDPAPVASTNSDDSSKPAAASTTPASGGDSIIERLRKKREMEEK